MLKKITTLVTAAAVAAFLVMLTAVPIDTGYRIPATIQAPEETRYHWEAVTTEAPWLPRDGAGLLSYGDYMYLLGGWAPGGAPAPYTVSDVWRSLDGVKWEQHAIAPWEPRHSAGYVVFNSYMWVIGGDLLRGDYQKGVWLTGDGTNWVRVGEIPGGLDRTLFQTYVFDGYIWILGGQTMDEFVTGNPVRDPVFYSDVWRTQDGKNWEKVSDNNPWAPRGMGIGSAVHEGKMHILGGGTYQTGSFGRTFVSDHWTSTDGEEWTREALTPWGPRQYHNTFSFDGRLWVVAGYSGPGELADTWHTCKEGWCELDLIPWRYRHAASVVEHKGAIYMLGGPLDERSVWRLDRIPGPR
jgi:hypothetical protein